MTLQDAARSFLGVRYHHAGRSREGGVDCAGLIALCLAELGVPFEDFQKYRPGSDMMALYEERLAVPFQRCELGEADVVLFRSPRIACHAAIVDGDFLIHAPYEGAVREELFTQHWRRLVHSCWILRKRKALRMKMGGRGSVRALRDRYGRSSLQA